MQNYRIEGKENVRFNGRKTLYSIYEYSQVHDAYIYVGMGRSPGWDASDEECIQDWLERQQSW